MDGSHLLPVAPPQHHTVFSHEDLGAKLKIAPEEGKQNTQLAPSLANPDVDSTRNSEPLGASGSDFQNDSRRQKIVADEINVPSNAMLNLRRPAPRKNLVLCFDGTGNKFHGDSSDSNILKIFRMLDRSGGESHHYYQPGIGTYVSSASLNTTGSMEKLKNWYLMAKDSAVGSSFGQHVVGGYKFLMQYYAAGDNIYMFGFSRGAYTARFLAEMLDWVGLITHGNEEMIQFAWRTFSEWKAMGSYSEEGRKKQKKAYDFMVSFRETFSRPVRRIRYLGLFDTVNSVPRFESAMMSRVHMPYSATSSAKVIRHAVSIDERRAKFRSDLLSPEGRHQEATDRAKAKHMKKKQKRHEKYLELFHNPQRYKKSKSTRVKEAPKTNGAIKHDRPGTSREEGRQRERGRVGLPHMEHISTSRYRAHSRSCSVSTARRSFDIVGKSRANSPDGANSVLSVLLSDDDESSDGDESDQDINELWFPGGHADIGGGWDLEGDEVPLSHVPLVWIVREARRAGLQFDEKKMRDLGCWDEGEEALKRKDAQAPEIEISGSPTTNGEKIDGDLKNENDFDTPAAFRRRILEGATKGKLHDCLAFGQGLPASSVLSWRIMEHIPFRRMDLRDDGSWKPIRWPLPRGEVRDMPFEAKIHHSALKRMEADPTYRPGNLILGGGGRGMKVAPAKAGMGKWISVAEKGNIVGECVVREKQSE